MTDHRNEELMDEIQAVLTRAGRALTPREILAQGDGLADGLASLMGPLRELCRDGTVSGENDGPGGARRYRLADIAAVQAPAAAAAEPQTAPAPNAGRIATIDERIRELLAEGETLGRAQIAERLGIKAAAASDGLCRLRHSAHVENLPGGLWRAITGAVAREEPLPLAPRAGNAVPPQKPDKAGQSRSRPSKSCQIMPKPGPETQPSQTAAEPAHGLLMAWRSDGVIELRRPTETIEITAAELAALTRFSARFTGPEATHD